MPRMNGLELVRRIRTESPVPILVLTVRQEEREKVRLLDAGADDYVTKPFGTAELVARARALLRRTEGRSDAVPISRWGDIEVDRDTRTVRRRGQPVHLTPTEFSLLNVLLSKPGAVWTHRQLLAAVWDRSPASRTTRFGCTWAASAASWKTTEPAALDSHGALGRLPVVARGMSRAGRAGKGKRRAVARPAHEKRS